MASLLAHLAPRTIPHAEMLGDDASDVLTCVAPAPGKGATTTPTTKALTVLALFKTTQSSTSRTSQRCCKPRAAAK